MFIDIFDIIKKYIIYLIIVILIPAIYGYFQGNTIDDNLYRFILGAFSYLVISTFAYVLFSFFISFFYGSFGSYDINIYIFLKNINRILPIVILFMLILLVYYKHDFFFIYTNIIQILKDLAISIILIIIFLKLICYSALRWFPHIDEIFNSNDRNETSFTGFLIIFIVFIVILIFSIFSWHLLLTSLPSSSYFQGSIEIDLQNKYDMNDSPIHTLIRATGPDTGISVEFKSESNNRNYDAIIYLDKNNESMSNKSLNGKLLGKGEYSIYINATGMSIGYYNLRCTQQKYTESYRLKRFYLEND